MTRTTTLQGMPALRRGWRAVAVLAAAGIALAWFAGCTSMQAGSSGASAEPNLRVQERTATLPPPPAPVRDWAYDEAPAVPAGLKPHQLLKNLTFASGSSSLDREGQGALLEAVKELKVNTRWHVLVAGFAGNRGEGASVGQARAESVGKFLRSQGIDAARISTMNLGSKYAQGREYEPQQQALDRRAEVWAFMD